MAKKPEEPVRPIIVKKITVVAGGHHGGAWKVAYADFVTAMMAFFLLLWILGATTEKQRKGIADYFSPTLVKNRKSGSGSGTGLLGGTSLTAKDKLPHPGGSGNKAITIPRDTTGGPKEGARRTREEIAKKLNSTERLRKLARQVRMVDTTEGIRIDLVDDANFSMFRMGTTVLTPEASDLLVALGQALEEGDGGLTVRGHTDALPYRPGTVGNNWSLSAGRAEATRQALMRDGIAEDRFRRIEGVADRELLIPDDPHDPRNRRISVTVMD
ncbi:flagellar motor protein MotB [Novosphingobium guangzhouense]|uniref:Flagellar motor protein n=1 Tax=Novosphingobium guangzhouense TaxID=1850347 RepID=A0A2K2FV90_9SPHN|nr:flagellar motor protein MotB [Novosphingobium guangzhouense]PNU02678.1 flagellar motor protein [Novosphingobium guangzhouense]